MQYAPLVLDAVAVLLLVYFAATRWRQGFVEALVRLLSVVVALAVAWVAAPVAAEYAFRYLFRGPILQNIENTMSEAAGSALPLLEQALQAVGELPPALVQFLGLGFLDLQELFAGLSAETLPDVAEQLVDLAIMPAAVSALQAVFFLVIFLLLFAVFTLFARTLRVANHLPLLGSLNRLLGLLIGLLEGAVVLFLLAVVLQLLLGLGVEIPFLTPEILEQTVLFSRLMSFGVQEAPAAVSFSQVFRMGV